MAFFKSWSCLIFSSRTLQCVELSGWLHNKRNVQSKCRTLPAVKNMAVRCYGFTFIQNVFDVFKVSYLPGHSSQISGLANAFLDLSIFLVGRQGTFLSPYYRRLFEKIWCLHSMPLPLSLWYVCVSVFDSHTTHRSLIKCMCKEKKEVKKWGICL